ncbi:hypothetical protein K470DRAFT_259237 [Piedraia hortae CBS 480.64]|uniref:Uncharacterized protein n=1 Tax=Piedraia hortae CBS 480.64 TaxID=1314780 RepID=A0A6A7BVR5_9PEZI|nr:hypothetical protein K470DRAFT_259237 [Piedraia hortae CBS 480.64]
MAPVTDSPNNSSGDRHNPPPKSPCSRCTMGYPWHPYSTPPHTPQPPPTPPPSPRRS